MINKVKNSSINFSSPNKFLIEIKGLLDRNMVDYLGGLSITYHQSHLKIDTTSLEGEIMDQAALIGILNTLYDLRYPILKVELLNK